MSETVAAGGDYPPPLPHEPIAELFPDIYWVQGSVRFGRAVTFNRNMVVLRHDDTLTIISPVRLSAEGETALRRADRCAPISTACSHLSLITKSAATANSAAKAKLQAAVETAFG